MQVVPRDLTVARLYGKGESKAVVRLRYGPACNLPPIAMARLPSPVAGLPSRSSPEVSGKPMVSEGWCGRGDSNPHTLASASPSSWCVCQFRHFRNEGRTTIYFLAGAAGGVAGAVGAEGAAAPLTTELGAFCHAMASPIEPSMKSTASTVVARVSMVAPDRAPNTV